jgi:hypothetical protein
MVRSTHRRKIVSRYSGTGVITSLGKRILGTTADVGGTLVNKAIDLLPVELHIPTYQYCGPGTKLSKRVKRGDPGINKLDAACKQHDIAYSQSSDNASRAIADRELAERAWARVKASDSSLAEKATAWTVTNIMKAKTKLGGGRRRRKCVRRKASKAALKKLRNLIGKGLYLRPAFPTGGGKKKRRQRRSRT